MELKQETVKQIRGLIIFTAVLIVCLWKFDVVISAFQFVLNIVYPFLLGGAIAFALSVPMNFVERKLFTERKISEKYKRKYEDHPDKKRKDETVKRANRKKKEGKKKEQKEWIRKLKKLLIVLRSHQIYLYKQRHSFFHEQ